MSTRYVWGRYDTAIAYSEVETALSTNMVYEEGVGKIYLFNSYSISSGAFVLNDPLEVTSQVVQAQDDFNGSSSNFYGYKYLATSVSPTSIYYGDLSSGEQPRWNIYTNLRSYSHAAYASGPRNLIRKDIRTNTIQGQTFYGPVSGPSQGPYPALRRRASRPLVAFW